MSQEKAALLNNFFTSCFNTCRPPLTLNSKLLDPEEIPADPLCTEDEILELLLQLDTNKSTGPNNISAKMLKEQLQALHPPSPCF